MPKAKSVADSSKSSRQKVEPASEVMPAWEQPDWQYETAIATVEAVIAKIEQDELDLTQVFDEFAAAAQRLQECEQFLNHYQQQFNLVVETLNSAE